jgi:hypothetical protein
MVFASTIQLIGIHQPPPFELTIRQKKYRYLDDSTDYSAMEREWKKIKKGSSMFHPIIVSFTVKPKNGTVMPIKYALYIARRERRT